MKKNFLLLIGFSLALSSAVVAQNAVSPEKPRNYKPQARELLPMPGELTDEMIFPVLGKYEYTTEEASTPVPVTITRDTENKGVVWVNGLPQGRFKADLKVSPAIYKIPTQKTLINQSEEDLAPKDSGTIAEDMEKEAPALRYSGHSIKEGTLLLDSASNRLYVDFGNKFNEAAPSSVFPELASDSLAMGASAEPGQETTTDKKTSSVTTRFVLTKVMEEAPAKAAGNDW